MNAQATNTVDMVEFLRPYLDDMAARWTAFATFQALTDAPYIPTLRGNRELNILADNYDIVMARRGVEKRACRN